MPSLRFGAVSILGVAAVTVSASISACSSNGGSQTNFPEDGSATSSGSGASSNGGTSGSNSSSSAGSSSSSSTGSSSSSTSTSSSGNPSSSGGNSSGSGSGTIGGDAGQAVFNDAGIPLCGNTPCDLRQNTCCIDQFFVARCMPHSTQNPPNEACFSCLSASDCTNGQVCCGLANSTAMTATTSCASVQNAMACPGTNTSTMAEAQVCETTAECKNNQACLAQSCVISSTVTAHLKMCGFQNRPPFNCTLG